MSEADDKNVIYEAPTTLGVALVQAVAVIVTVLINGIVVVCCCCSYDTEQCIEACQPNAVERCEFHSVRCAPTGVNSRGER